MKVRVQVFPTVICNHLFVDCTKKEAAREMIKQFDGNRINFGEATFAGEVSDSLSVTPIDAQGHAITRKSTRFALQAIAGSETNIPDHKGIYRVSMQPIVSYAREFDVHSPEIAAAMMLREFDGNVIDFGQCMFLDLGQSMSASDLTNLVIADPLDDNGRVIFSQSVRMKLADVEAFNTAMTETNDPKESAPAM